MIPYIYPLQHPALADPHHPAQVDLQDPAPVDPQHPAPVDELTDELSVVGLQQHGTAFQV